MAYSLIDACAALSAPVEALRLRAPETAQKGKAGAARAFTNPNRVPTVISMHEPHPGKNLGATLLRKYLQKLLLNEDEFMHLLEDC